MTQSDLPQIATSDEITNDVEQLADRARRFASKGKAENTKRAYRSDFAHFTGWCSEHELPELPSNPQVIGLYITAMADRGYATSTIERRLVAISQAHKLAGFSSPTTHEQVREVWRGIRRELDTGQKEKRALTTVDLRRILAQLDSESLLDSRDAALS